MHITTCYSNPSPEQGTLSRNRRLQHRPPGQILLRRLNKNEHSTRRGESLELMLNPAL